MNQKEFLQQAKRGNGECILFLKVNNVLPYKESVKNIFLNNYAFLLNDEFRSAYAYELISFYNDDNYFLNLLWNKIIKTNIKDYYTYDYLLNNLYFILKHNGSFNYENKIKNLLMKLLNKENFTFYENCSINSLITLIIDLNLNVSIDEIISHYFCEFKNSNLDLSNIEHCYHLYFSHKKNLPFVIDKEGLNRFDFLLKCIKDEDSFSKYLPYISTSISIDNLELLLYWINDNKSDILAVTNILKIFLYSKYRNNKILIAIAKNYNNFNSNQKAIVYDALTKIKSAKAPYIYSQMNFDDSLFIGLSLYNYDKNKYDEVHRKIKKIRLNYKNSDNWFEVENALIAYCNKKDIDVRLLGDLKYFFKNGLSSYSRYKMALVLKKYNMLDEYEIKSLKYDADYRIRNKFKNF